MATDRRKFLQRVGIGALAASFPASIKRALAIPAHHRTGTIADVEHIVILMQENRSFDHYFGTLRGVRGFGDPRAVTLPSGDPVWYQPDGTGPRAAVPSRRAQPRPAVPRGPAARLGRHARRLERRQVRPVGAEQGHDHHGVPDPRATSPSTTRSPTPSRSATPTTARSWGRPIPTATTCGPAGSGNDGKNGGPVLDNAEAGYDWSHLSRALADRPASRWKIYQDAGAGLDAAHFWGWGDDAYIGNYGDNSLLYFHQYQNAQPGSPLFEGALHGTNISQGGTLFDSVPARTSSPASCRRSRGSSRRRPTPSTPTGRRTTAPGTSRRSSTR